MATLIVGGDRLRHHRRAVAVTLRGEKHDELLIETPGPAAVVSRLPVS